MRKERLEKLASNIRAERHRVKLSQDVVAEKINLSIKTLSKIENARQAASILAIIDIAKALNVDINVLTKDV